MDELPKRVLYAFFPERILTFEQAAKRSSTSLPYVRNVISKEFIADGLVEEVIRNVGSKHAQFRLTRRGIVAARQINSEREWQRARFIELRASGLTASQAAIQLAIESVKTDKLTS